MITKTIEKYENITYEKRIITYEKSEIDVSSLLEIFILTTDQGPFFEDIMLVLIFEGSTLIIPSEHPKFQSFLFDSLSKDFSVDFSEYIKAMSSTNNAKFILWKKA